jgi:hypothetical protein
LTPEQLRRRGLVHAVREALDNSGEPFLRQGKQALLRAYVALDDIALLLYQGTLPSEQQTEVAHSLEKLDEDRRTFEAEKAEREALKMRRRDDLETNREVASKLEVIRAAARMDFPTTEIDRMLEEIERGYGSGMPS